MCTYFIYLPENGKFSLCCTEPFFVMINDLLTTKELDKFKKKLRTNIY